MDDLPSTRQHPIYRVRRVRPKMAAGAGEEIWVIDQACSVKMAGYWPGSIFACLWSETESRSINTQKKKKKSTRPISSHLDRTGLVNKGISYTVFGQFFMRDAAGRPERAR